jgi:hypothetical protein
MRTSLYDYVAAGRKFSPLGRNAELLGTNEKVGTAPAMPAPDGRLGVGMARRSIGYSALAG